MVDKKAAKTDLERREANKASQKACRARKKENGRGRCEITDPWPKRKHVPLIKAYAKKLEDEDNE